MYFTWNFGSDVVLQHQLNVQYSPSMNSSSPSVQHVVKGQRLRLFCNADGNPRPEIRWTFEDGAPPAGAVKDQVSDRDFCLRLLELLPVEAKRQQKDMRHIKKTLGAKMSLNLW
jgi:hypothetical protein